MKNLSMFYNLNKVSQSCATTIIICVVLKIGSVVVTLTYINKQNLQNVVFIGLCGVTLSQHLKPSSVVLVCWWWRGCVTLRCVSAMVALKSKIKTFRCGGGSGVLVV